jgi:hypothetical protein
MRTRLPSALLVATRPKGTSKKYGRYWELDLMVPQGPTFSRFVMIRPVQSERPRSGEQRFCAGQGAAGPSKTIRTYVS